MASWLSMISVLVIYAALFQSTKVEAKTVRYELTIAKGDVNLSGKKTVDWALKVNGGIPAPTLEFTEGDDAEIEVRNQLEKEEVSIHWHGILLPPSEDGVAYVNTPPILPGRSRLFKFRLRQNGTYWYHSHTAVQEQKGVYGALVIHPKKEIIKADKDLVVVLSDWSDENADQIIRNLRKDGDYYLYKKNSMRSLIGAARAGALSTYLKGQWDRMGGMDLSDVGYDAFLINGMREQQALAARPGERIRIRLINAAASSYFYVSLGGLPMQVISADGMDIEPVSTNEILMGMAETYDVLFTVPEGKNYELRATSQDVTGHASAWIGIGEKVYAPEKPYPNLYASMDHSEHAGHHHGHAAASTVIPSLTVDNIIARSSTQFPAVRKVTELKLVLGGDMERYVWHINGKAIHEERNIVINEGDVIRFIFQNETMMHHPMHLHGHFFRVINGHGDRSPLKHTVDVPPHGSRTIEFIANEPGQWMLHCHNLYHMKTGMARVVKYMTYQPSPEIASLEKQDPHLHDHPYTYGLLEAATNHAKADFKLIRTWDEVELKTESRSNVKRGFAIGGKWETEGDLVYRRWLGNYLNLMAGGSLFEDDGFGIVGVGYTLPLLVKGQLFINHEGNLRLDLEKEFQWTSSIFSHVELSWRPNWEGEHEAEFEVSLMYGPSWVWAAGLMLTNDSLGFGAQVQF